MLDPAHRVEDDLLVLRSQQGEAAAFEELVRRWQQPLLNFAFRLTGNWEAARDVVQDTWMVVIRSLLTLNEVGRFRSWLFRIASNKCQDYWRRNHWHRHLAENLRPKLEGPAPAPPAGTPLDLEEALRQVSPESRAVLVLMYLQDFSVDEIAEILAIPEGTVKSRLFHARQQLRELMEK